MTNRLNYTKRTKQLILTNEQGDILKKECSLCGKFKEAKHYRKKTEGHLKAPCKPCESKQKSEYDKSIATQRSVYRQRSRASLVGAPDRYSLDDYESLKSASKGYCMISGKYMGFDNLEVDHVTPLSNPFSLGSTRGNLILVSSEVNQSKRDTCLFDWINSPRAGGLVDFKKVKETIDYLAVANELTTNSYIELAQSLEAMNKNSKL